MLTFICGVSIACILMGTPVREVLGVLTKGCLVWAALVATGVFFLALLIALGVGASP